jgi:membrane protease YdiL (CAAX protease family)
VSTLATCACASTAVIVTLMVVGAVATGVAWYVVTRRGASIFLVFAGLNGVLGIAALATGTVVWSAEFSLGAAAMIGLLVGVGLYVATVLFVIFVRRWPAFAENVTSLYERGAGVSLVQGLILSAAIAAPGEELFWRGLFQQHIVQNHGRGVAALGSWLGYIAASAVSLSLPFTAAAIVGGGVWVLLAAWTGGVLASLVCHALWTGLMLAFPPPGGVRPSEEPSEEAA